MEKILPFVADEFVSDYYDEETDRDLCKEDKEWIIDELKKDITRFNEDYEDHQMKQFYKYVSFIDDSRDWHKHFEFVAGGSGLSVSIHQC